VSVRMPRFPPTIVFPASAPWLARGTLLGVFVPLPDNLRDKDAELRRHLTAACPEMAELAHLMQEFAELLTTSPAASTTPAASRNGSATSARSSTKRSTAPTRQPSNQRT